MHFGGKLATITGTGLSTATAVHFGGTAATPTVVSDSQITAVVPAGAAAGAVGVSVTTAGGSNNGFSRTYVDTPTVTGFTPTSGPPSGGSTVPLTGTNLLGATAVRFGATPASSFTVVSATQLTAVTPGGTSNSLVYTRVAAPGI